MKKVTVLLIVLFSILFSTNANSQTVINVKSGIGTLNDAIGANGAATYVLEAGGWYGLSATLQITSGVKIIGQTPTEGKMAAIIQNGATSAGATFPFMFVIAADLTLKNVFIVNSDLNEGLGSGVFYQLSSAKLVLDSVTVDPVGVNFLLFQNAEHTVTKITNSLFMRQGNTLGINDGGVFWNQSGKWDSLYVENNTFVDVGTAWMLSASQQNGDRELFHWINHNTFLFGKAHMYTMSYPDALFFTNNLCWMFDTYLFKAAGPETWDPGNGNKYQALFDADTLVTGNAADGKPINETFPSQRKMYIRYNSNYRTKAVWDLIASDKSKNVTSYLKPFIFSTSYIDSCRATRMFNDHTNFPNFSQGNNIEDFGAEITANDPKFTTSKIYDLTTKASDWAVMDWRFIRGEQGLPDASTWPNYFYSADENNGNPKTWPRFNGKYTNATLLTASIEKLPLGDLNWFPTQKALWQLNQKKVMNYILALNTTQLTISDVQQIDNQIPDSYSLYQNYPNPFNPSTTIKYNIPKQGLVTLKIYNLVGQEVATLVNQEQSAGTYAVDFNASKLSSGVYFYKLNTGDVSLVKKLMILK